MEADWEFEIASDAPRIDAAWSGYLDLRSDPASIRTIPEASRLRELAAALLHLNEPDSPVWTAKCDVWEPDAIDPDEFEATEDAAARALACYIDLLPAHADTWSTLDLIADWCRELCARLRAKPLRQCRADLIIRSAILAPDQTSLGITAYIAGCGAALDEATATLGRALHLFALTIVENSVSTTTDQKLQ